MADLFLRQTCQVIGTVANGGQLTATFPKTLIGAGGRIVAAQLISGPGATFNSCNHSGSDFVIDVGGATLSATISLDVLMWDETVLDANNLPMVFKVGGPVGSNVMACWAGEWTNLDQSNYGFQGNKVSNNGNVDYDASYGWAGTAQNLSLARAGGNNFNYSPELGLWVVGGPAPVVSVTGQSFYADGYVTDGTNLWMAIQTFYVNAPGQLTATWNLSASAGYTACNFTMKSLSFPSSSQSRPGGILLGGIG